MTREEILAMPVGRELDNLVALHVMGWEIEGTYWLSNTCRIRTWEQTSYPGFQPSTDISAAWEALEEFPLVMIERVEIFEGRITVNVTIYPDSCVNKSLTVSTSSLAESAAKAALIAVMEGQAHEAN